MREDMVVVKTGCTLVPDNLGISTERTIELREIIIPMVRPDATPTTSVSEDIASLWNRKDLNSNEAAFAIFMYSQMMSGLQELASRVNAGMPMGLAMASMLRR